MITDGQTNFLYLADSLMTKYPGFYKRFETLVRQHQVPLDIINVTKDLWAVDYMPIQVAEKRFVQFSYNPDYLRNSLKWQSTLTNVDEVCALLNIQPIKSNIILDGGNIVRTNDKVIMCDKVFRENPEYKTKDLIRKLEELLLVDNIIFIPTQPKDIIGHADGMVRFYNNDTVLINNYSKEDKNFRANFYSALKDARLNTIEIPYSPYDNKNYIDANGIYINYLHMIKAIIIPIFRIKEDEQVVLRFEQLFKKIAFIDANEIALQGGVLNCISWNILKTN